ncbi:MAG TPA: lysophospholipid acyltransferase family protein [Anaerovoracaceae bacterium]|nr:lysophospholipid acyltransferase family protein [Anaerovoracaceae bacterium]
MIDYKRPNRLAWYIASRLISFYSRFVLKQTTTIKNIPKTNGPFLLLGNHMCNKDFIYSISSISPKYLHFVVARKYFHNSKMLKWLNRGSAIPKSLATSDITTIIAMINAVQKGESVGIYPSGRIGQWGVSYSVHEGTATLVKKLNIPVIIIRGYGGYFANPPYMKTNRRPGPTHTEAFLGFTQSEVEEMSKDNILARLNELLYVDQYTWLEKTNATYKGNHFAEGLENFAYRCPNCGKVHSLTTEGNTIKCSFCDLEGYCDYASRFTWDKGIGVKDLRSWHDVILHYELIEITSIPNWELTSEVEVATYGFNDNDIEIHSAGNGIVKLNNNFFSYEGSYEGQDIKLEIKIDNIRYFPYESGFNFQVYIKKSLYEFRTKDPRDCARFSMCLDAIKKIAGNEYV